MQRAWISGISVLIVGVAVYYALVMIVEASWPSLVALACFLVVAGMSVGYRAPRAKLLVGAALAIPAAVILGAADMLFGLSGNYGEAWPGPLNSLMLALVVIPVAAILGLLGATAGASWSRRASDA